MKNGTPVERHARRAGLLAVTALVLAGLGGALVIAQEKKPISVYWSAGQIGKNMKAAFADTFPDKNLLKIVEGSDNPRFTQMQANRDSPNFDVGTFIDVLLPLVIKSGLIIKLDEKKIPNLAEVDPALRGWDDFAVPYTYGTWGIVYNADKVKKPITSWADLFREDLKSYVTSPNITFNSSIFVLDALARLKGGSLQKPDGGFELMRQLRLSGPGLWDQESVAIGWLKTGEVLASTFYSGSALRLMQETDTAHLRFVVPSEGGYLVRSNLVRVANSPNPAGGDAFLNYILSQEAQAHWPAIGRTRPANKNVKIPDDVAASVPSADKLRKLDMTYFVANRSEIVQKWNDIVNR